MSDNKGHLCRMLKAAQDENLEPLLDLEGDPATAKLYKPYERLGMLRPEGNVEPRLANKLPHGPWRRVTTASMPGYSLLPDSSKYRYSDPQEKYRETLASKLKWFMRRPDIAARTGWGAAESSYLQKAKRMARHIEDETGDVAGNK